MRTFLLSIALLTAFVSTDAKAAGDSTGTYDIPQLTSRMMEKLNTALSLEPDQRTGVSSAIKDFLTDKEPILPLMKTDPSAYAGKFNLLNGNLISKLKNILHARQMTGLLSLKPRPNDTGNVLSHLFY